MELETGIRYLVRCKIEDHPNKPVYTFHPTLREIVIQKESENAYYMISIDSFDSLSTRNGDWILKSDFSKYYEIVDVL